MNRSYRIGLWTALLVTGLASTLLIGSCRTGEDITEERIRRARGPGATIKIAAAWPWSVRYDGLYWEGLQLAAREINADGGILGRTVLIQREDDKESVNEGRLIAQRLAEDPDVVAVIGHLNSHVSIPAARIYEAAGLLMLTPGSTSSELTRDGPHFVFRSVNSDDEIARRMATYAKENGYQRIVIGYVRNAYGLGLANAFEEFALREELAIVDRQSYDPASSASPQAYARLVGQWGDLEFDAFFLAGMAPQAGYLVKQFRQAGLQMPIFGGDALDTPELIAASGSAAEGMVVASVFHPADPRPEVRRFVSAFTSANGRPPDSWAARGYEALRMLAGAMESAGSIVPSDVARQLRSNDEANFSLSGPVHFDANGEVVGRAVVTAIVQDGRFAYLGRGMPADDLAVMTGADDD